MLGLYGAEPNEILIHSLIILCKSSVLSATIENVLLVFGQRILYSDIHSKVYFICISLFCIILVKIFFPLGWDLKGLLSRLRGNGPLIYQ